MNDELSKITEEINEYQIIEPEKITIELIENNKTKQSRLVFNEDVNFSVKLENRKYKYSFVSPVYVDYIIIRAKNSLTAIKLSYSDIYDEHNVIETKLTENAIRYTIKKSIKNFIITPPKSAKIELTKIEIHGYYLEKHIAIQKDIKSLEKLHETLQAESKNVLEENTNVLSKIEKENIALQELHTELDNSIDELTEKKEVLENEKTELETQITQKKQSIDELMESVVKRNATIEELIKKERILENSLQQQEVSLKNFNSDISRARDELKKAESDTSLIAYDIKSYVENANNDIKVYLWLSALPWLLIAIVTGFIFFGSADLSTVFSVKEDAQIWTIFWSRAPFVVIATTVLFVAYEVSNIFINRIISIHQQKSDFAKIGIIAKDISDSSVDGLDLTDKEKFELRTKLKMDMLKSHLSRELDKKYEYKINPNILDKYRDMLILKKKENTSAEDEVNE